MWRKLTNSVKGESKFYTLPNKSTSSIHEYNRQNDFDFSDGPPPDTLTVPRDPQDGRYNINEHTVSPFIEGMALEPLTAPSMPAAQPGIVITPPTPPWATPIGSRRGSDAEQSDGEGRGKGTHRKALSDDGHNRNNSRSDAARRALEAALAFKAIERALQNMEIQNSSTPAQRAINYSWPLNRQPRTEPEQDVPRDASPPPSGSESDPFEFEN